MKKLFYILAFLTFVILNPKVLFAQEKMEEPKENSQPKEEKMQENNDSKDEIPERLKFYKEKYEFKVPGGGSKTTEEIFDICAKSVEELKCQIANKTLKADEKNNGLLKGKIESDFGVFAMGSGGDTFDSLQKYSYRVPIIRGGVWTNGRVQFKVFLKEYEDGAVDIQIKAEISGMESFVTNEIHFWKSNGIFETVLMEKLKTKLGIK